VSDELEVTERQLARNDWIAGLIILAVFVVMLVASWNRWTHPIVDHGREMNLPARLLAGDRLYLDIYYYYGPLAPYLGAALYSIFGIRLAVLHAAGIVCALVILALIYWLARQLLGVVESALTTCLVLVTCALPPYLGNYVQPYAYAALYGWMFSLTALACAARHLSDPNGRWLGRAGVCVGVAAACKPELLLLAVSPVATAWLLSCLWARRWLWRPFMRFAMPALVVVALTYGPIVLIVPWRLLVGDTFRSFSQPQLMYFARWLSGQLAWPDTGWALGASVGLSAMVCGMSALGALLLDSARTPAWLRHGWWVVALVIGGWWVWTRFPNPSAPIDVSPFRSAPVVLAGTLGLSMWHVLTSPARGARPPISEQTLLLVAVFSLIAVGRVMFNVSLRTPYTIFSVPTLIVVYLHLLLRAWPALLPTATMGADARRAGIALITVAVGTLGLHHATIFRAGYRAEIQAPRGRLLTAPELAGPFNEAIQYVRAQSAPDEAVVTLPEGTLINFMAERRNPLPDEIIVPGYLTPARVQDTIHRIERERVRLILLLNRLTPEYRDVAFGVDYNQDLMRWIDDRYRPVATFSGKGASTDDLRFGAPQFFIRVYERQAP
jgi:Dolichyl-phosphate-mannose-protein mannosyltransferase